MLLPTALLGALLVILVTAYATIPKAVQILGTWLGRYLQSKTRQRRELLFSRLEADRTKASDHLQTASDANCEKAGRTHSHSAAKSHTAGAQDRAWTGVIGFFHPFCNAGGGGERVLWAAIRVTQQQWPNALCVVYTGDHEVDKEQIIAKVKERFSIQLNAPTIAFLYLSTRRYVLSSTWPHFTLLGQSLGSVILGFDAFLLLAPDIFIDTMGYAFVMSLCKFLFPDVPTAAYVHYPTISTDMLESLSADAATGKGVNAGAGRGLRGRIKRQYWHVFARLYGWVGGSADVVMTNSSWTQDHIHKLWSSTRARRKKPYPVEVVFPPVAVEELVKGINVTLETEKKRQARILYIAQFRHEKNHALILRSFAQFLRKCYPSAITNSTLVDDSNIITHEADSQIPNLRLIGSVRDASDERHIYSLRLLAHELHITEYVTFLLNASWDTILSELGTASIGVNGMWNEHFGIGVVEYQAAGLIGVVHDSGGPKRDICIEMGSGEGGVGPTGLHASDAHGFAAGFEKVLNLMSDEERFEMRQRARRSSRRFSGRDFDRRWLLHMERLVHLRLEKETCH